MSYLKSPFKKIGLRSFSLAARSDSGSALENSRSVIDRMAELLYPLNGQPLRPIVPPGGLPMRSEPVLARRSWRFARPWLTLWLSVFVATGDTKVGELSPPRMGGARATARRGP